MVDLTDDIQRLREVVAGAPTANGYNMFFSVVETDGLLDIHYRGDLSRDREA